MSAAYFTRDLYQRYWRPRAGNRELLLATYSYILVVVAGGFTLARGSTSINDIWEWIIMGLGGGLLIPAMLKFYWWRFNAGGLVSGTLVGIVAALADRISRKAYASNGFHVYIEQLFPDSFPRELVGFSYLAVVGLLGSIVGTYLSKPTEPEVLEHFYRTTRPFGIWGPLKAKLSSQVRAAMTREHRNDLIALPFTLGWQITLFLLPMLLLIGNFAAFWPTLGIFLSCIGGMYVFWYRNLPPAEVNAREAVSRPAEAR